MKGQTSRIVGIDIARGLAVFGMFIAHTYPRVGDAELIVDGRSSILFATLAGISLGLLSGSRDPSSRPRSGVISGIVVRAAFLFLLGVALSTLPSRVAVILDYYGIMFVLMLPLLYLPRVALALAAVLLWAGMPLLAGWAAVAGPQSGWPGLAAEYLLVGSYPALVWLPFLLTGLLCARSDLTSGRTQGWMIVGGAVAMVIGYGGAQAIPGLSAEAHSGSTAEILGSGGFAVAVIGVLLWACRARAARAVLHPVAAAGSMPLTIYTLQILLLALFVTLAEAGAQAPEYPGFPLMIGLIVATMAFGTLWRATVGTGPLERLLRYLAKSEPGEKEARRQGAPDILG